MSTIPQPADFAASAVNELHNVILSFWLERCIDNERGGFYGEVSPEGVPVPTAEKGAVLNARILWTFSAAARLYPDKVDYRAAADRAYDYFTKHFVDKEFGGTFWSVDCDGNMLDGKKQTYAQGFSMYGLAEYYALTGNKAALDLAMEIFDLVENKAFEPTHGGYWEARARDWQPMADIRLSARDMNVPKSFNTSLHVLEAYMRLMEVAPCEKVRKALEGTVRIHTDHIYNPRTGHLELFFDVDWKSLSTVVSYGHDIEAVWLIDRAARLCGDAELIATVEKMNIHVADVTLAEGIDADGGIYYEGYPDKGTIDRDRHWWPQVEAALGFLCVWKQTGEEKYYNAAWDTWNYGVSNLRNREIGEWYFRVSNEGEPYREIPMASFWKCPYHGGRACMEIAGRLK
ncbi:MAG: AGE family epimerase/isomerase [Opitutales bacterium]|nr:AGE family epimerase/isomerase [Opitutales bacterium]